MPAESHRPWAILVVSISRFRLTETVFANNAFATELDIFRLPVFRAQGMCLVAAKYVPPAAGSPQRSSNPLTIFDGHFEKEEKREIGGEKRERKGTEWMREKHPRSKSMIKVIE